MSRFDPSGLATAVAVGAPIPSNPFGHAAVATTGEGVYSYGTADPVGENFTQYLENQAEYRETTIVVINTTPEQEAAIRAYIDEYIRENYKLIGNNCSTVIADALFAAGVGESSLSDPNMGPMSLPTDLLAAVLSMPGATIYTIPPGGLIPSALTQFNH